MRILLHDIGKDVYYRGPSEWTGDRREAADLVSTGEAVKVASSLRLENAEVVLDFADAYENVVLKLQPDGLSSQQPSRAMPSAAA